MAKELNLLVAVDNPHPNHSPHPPAPQPHPPRMPPFFGAHPAAAVAVMMVAAVVRVAVAKVAVAAARMAARVVMVLPMMRGRIAQSALLGCMALEFDHRSYVSIRQHTTNLSGRQSRPVARSRRLVRGRPNGSRCVAR